MSIKYFRINWRMIYKPPRKEWISKTPLFYIKEKAKSVGIISNCGLLGKNSLLLKISGDFFHPLALLDFEWTTGVAMTALEAIIRVLVKLRIMGGGELIPDFR